ncbi:uncharacterized protein N7503_006957 [Penicillium pulvis]|uniref:uncharacterized protein n=1 Tax=Penicillium pulvis TaxID=1562058 RepID=UPI0025487E2C|nr:uncharacterized protein N7503_006957 [Penicillium pulvis]KAJ5797661.1 hypothetical protein N7503_006957 [Penicillium pulvis]
MFEGKFKEGQEQTAILEEIEGVISVQSLEAFLQWIYLHKIEFDLREPEHQISAAIELARFADMCNVRTMESEISQYLKRVMIDNPSPEKNQLGEVDTFSVISQHIVSATFLPQGHEIRRLLAMAAVTGYLCYENHKFAQETRDYPTFGADLLQQVGYTLQGLKMPRLAKPEVTFTDPLDGCPVTIHRFLTK